MAKTNRNDVVSNFVRYHGRQPKASDEATIQYLTTKSPNEVEKLLAKDSPITKGLVWSEYKKVENKFKESAKVDKERNVPKTTITGLPENLSTKKLGKSGVNALFSQYYGRDADQRELDYWEDKSDADLRPRLLPNSERELARNKQKITEDQEFNLPDEKQSPGVDEEFDRPADVDISMYDQFINNDPFLKEQFQDQQIRDNFAKMPPELQMGYIQMMKSLGKQVDAGKVVNPNIEITPDKIKEFTNQAISELDPYYQEKISNYKQDLDTSISRLTEDFNTGVRNAEEPFKRNLAIQAESEAQAGTVYGSERGKREDISVEQQQQAIDEVSKTLGRGVEDKYTAAERALGSDVLGGIARPSIQRYNVSSGGFEKSGTRNLFDPRGGVVGSLQKERETSIRGRASELEESYRRQRALNTSQL